jgi:hypothetical protein
VSDACSLADGSGSSRRNLVRVRTAGPACIAKLKTRPKHLSHIGLGQIRLRARAALTTFKTLKTDLGTGL